MPKLGQRISSERKKKEETFIFIGINLRYHISLIRISNHIREKVSETVRTIEIYCFWPDSHKSFVFSKHIGQLSTNIWLA